MHWHFSEKMQQKYQYRIFIYMYVIRLNIDHIADKIYMYNYLHPTFRYFFAFSE